MERENFEDLMEIVWIWHVFNESFHVQNWGRGQVKGRIPFFIRNTCSLVQWKVQEHTKAEHGSHDVTKEVRHVFVLFPACSREKVTSSAVEPFCARNACVRPKIGCYSQDPILRLHVLLHWARKGMTRKDLERAVKQMATDHDHGHGLDEASSGW